MGLHMTFKLRHLYHVSRSDFYERLIQAGIAPHPEATQEGGSRKNTALIFIRIALG